MTRESLVFILGIAVVLAPYVGVPNSWKRTASLVLGLLIALLGYQLRRRAYLRSIATTSGERVTDVYAEQVEAVSAESTALPTGRARRSAKRV